MTIKQAIHFLETHYDVRIPYGYSKISNSVLGDKDYYLTVGLINDQNDCSSNIRMNDIGYGRFKLTFENGLFVLTRLNHTLTCNPVDKYCALSLQRVSYRKIKAKSIDELVNKFDKYLTRFLELVNEKVEKNEIYKQENYKPEYFSFN